MSMRILALEPFFGGSHKNFIEGLIKHSRHSFTVKTMPARFWKWRMRGAALYFSRQITAPDTYDLIFCSDLMSVSDLKALLGNGCPPIVVYFHENQLSYPLPAGEKMDYQFGFTDITNCLTAEQVLFNSRFHLSCFSERLPDFLNMMPEYRCAWISDIVAEKSSVLYPGCDFPWHRPDEEAWYDYTGHGFPEQNGEGTPWAEKPSTELASNTQQGELLYVPYNKGSSPRLPRSSKPPLIIWNHRWEFDKNPELFFSVLKRIDKKGIDFSLALLGENFQAVPTPFIEAKQIFGEKIVAYGFEKDRRNYISLLKKGDFVVSTAIQENFGIAIMEAIRYGCLPLLPDRLSYPELIPADLHSLCLYSSESEFESKLTSWLTSKKRPILQELVSHAAGFSWERRAPVFDDFFVKAARKTGKGEPS